MSSPGALSTSQLDSTFGCLFLAVVFGSVLWGIGCLQLHLYCEKYWKSDKLWLKLWVSVLWVADTVHHLLLLSWLYTNFVRGIGDPSLLLLFPKTATNTGILAPIINIMSQFILLRRVWYLSLKSYSITGILIAAVVGQFVLTVVYYAFIFDLTLIAELSRYLRLNQALNATIACVETLLAATLVYLLWRNRSGFKKTDSIVNRLVLYTIGSGLVTAVMTVLAVISASLAPNSLVYALSDLILPRLYMNCVFSSLNARSSLRENLSGDGAGVSIRFEDLNPASAPMPNFRVSADVPRKASLPRVIECRVDVDVESGSERRKPDSMYGGLESDSMTDHSKAV